MYQRHIIHILTSQNSTDILLGRKKNNPGRKTRLQTGKNPENITCNLLMRPSRRLSDTFHPSTANSCYCLSFRNQSDSCRESKKCNLLLLLFPTRSDIFLQYTGDSCYYYSCHCLSDMCPAGKGNSRSRPSCHRCLGTYQIHTRYNCSY